MKLSRTTWFVIVVNFNDKIGRTPVKASRIRSFNEAVRMIASKSYLPWKIQQVLLFRIYRTKKKLLWPPIMATRRGWCMVRSGDDCFWPNDRAEEAYSVYEKQQEKISPRDTTLWILIENDWEELHSSDSSLLWITWSFSCPWAALLEKFIVIINATMQAPRLGHVSFYR